MTTTDEALVRATTRRSPPSHSPRLAGPPLKPQPISARRDFAIDLSALALALSAVIVATAHAPRPAQSAVVPIVPAAVIATVIVSLYLNGAWDSQADGRQHSRPKALCRGYAWAIAALCVAWSSLGIAHELIWILYALPAALGVSLLLHTTLYRLTRISLGFDPLAKSAVVVGNVAGVLAFLTQTQDQRFSHLSLDAVILTADPIESPPPKSVGGDPGGRH